MAISPEKVTFDDVTMWVALTDGRTLGVPLAWFPRLLRASPAERATVTLSPMGLHWEALDEDISVAGLIAGRGIWRGWVGWRELSASFKQRLSRERQGLTEEPTL